MSYQMSLNQALGQALYSSRGWAGVDASSTGLTIRVGHTVVATRPDNRETTFWRVLDVPLALETIAKAVGAQAAANLAAEEWHRSAPRAERMVGTLRTHP